MAMTIHLPDSVEQAYAAVARRKGVSIDVLVTDILVSNMPATEPLTGPELVEENGVPVLRAGCPIEPSIVNDTLDAIRWERDLSALRRS